MGVRHAHLPKFHRSLQPKEFIDLLYIAEEVMEFKGVPEEMKVPLIAARLWGRAGAWWQHFKMNGS